MTTSRPPLPGGQSRRGRLALVAALYCTQNLSLGFFTYAFLTIAQARGVPLALIGAAAGIATLLTLKFLWAPVVDRFGSRRLGHYRGWLLLTQSLLAIGCASLALFDPATQFMTLLVLFAVIFVVAATQDVAADAAATRLLRPDERGLGNGFQSAGSSVAQVVGGGVVLVVYQAAGWQIAALCLAACTLVALPFVLRWREEADERDVPAPASRCGRSPGSSATGACDGGASHSSPHTARGSPSPTTSYAPCSSPTAGTRPRSACTS